jgi:hypothetical protein
MAGDRVVSALVIALAWSSLTRAGESRLLAEESAGIVPVTGEVRVVVSGIRGEIRVEAGKEGEVRFQSAAPGPKGAEIPVALWLEDGTFRFLPRKDVPESGRLLVVHVPDDMNVTVEATDSTVTVAGIASSVEVRGERLKVSGGGQNGSFSGDVQSGSVAVSSVNGDVTVRGRDLDVKLGMVAGSSSLHLTGGHAQVAELRGPLDADLDGVVMTVGAADVPVHVRERGGQLELRDLAQGGEFSLSGTPLKMTRCQGDITVESDGDVQFLDNKAALHFISYGGSVRGSGNTGLLEVKTSNAEVVLEKIVGPVRIQGDGLKVRLKDIGGELLVYATSSDVQIDGVSADVTVENTQGDVTVKGASGAVGVKSSGGDVSLLGMVGPAQVEADGRHVAVSWTSLPGKDSVVHNDGGDITVHFPAGGGCRVEARSKFGRVETDLPRVEILEGGSSAQGVLGNASRPTIRVESGGDVQLLGGSPGQP